MTTETPVTQAEEIEALAQFLHDEGGFGDSWTAHTWPEHPGDTGQRDGAWVKIVPSDVQAQFREVATRLHRGFIQGRSSSTASSVSDVIARFARVASNIPNDVADDRTVCIEMPYKQEERVKGPRGETPLALVISLDGLTIGDFRSLASLANTPAASSVGAGELRAILEKARAAMSCYRCGGRGSITTGDDELDECPACHGEDHPTDLMREIDAALAASSHPASAGDEALRMMVERFIADYDDGDRADAGVHPLMEGHVRDFRRALAATPAQEGEVACDQCARANPVWFAPNEIWNLAVGGAEATDDPGGILCPNCFIARAEAAGIVPTAWKIGPEVDETERLPRLDAGLIEAAMLAHYGKGSARLGIDGVDLTADDHNWTFRQGFKRMWAGVRKELMRRATDKGEASRG